MKRCIAVFLLALLWCGSLRGQGADDQFIRIYRTIQEADRLAESGQSARALQQYQAAEGALKRFQQAYPDWNDKVLQYRLKYIAERMAPLRAKAETEPPPAPPRASAPGTGASTEAAAPAAPPPPADWEDQMKGLREQLQALESDRAALQARLREALSAQPASVDPAELARAGDRIRALEKEKELLQVALRQGDVRQRSEADTARLRETQLALAEAQRRLAEQERQLAELRRAPKADRPPDVVRRETEATAQLRSENELLKRRMTELEKQVASPPELETLKRELADARAALAEQKAQNERLLEEQKRLGRELEALKKSARESESQRARAENQLREVEQRLARQIAQPSDSSRDDRKLQELQQEQERWAREVSRLQEESSANQAALRQAEQDKASLEARLKDMLGAQPARKAEADRIRQLEKERENLQRKLAAAERETQRQKKERKSAPNAATRREIASLKARLEALEARKVPFTAEELALFNAPEPQLTAESTPSSSPDAAATSLVPSILPSSAATASTATTPATRSRPTLSSNASRLIAEAESAFASRRYDEAAEKFQAVLKEDDQDVRLLSNLATTQIEQQRLDEAEATLRQALGLAPDDARCLTLLGIVKFRQQRVEDAVTALSRSVQLDPKNPESQNYLGVALSEQGHRGPAEAALRRAVSLSPDYASAHNNLAVVYATQKPPFRELARWHYQKAINNGHPRNPDLERILDAPSTSP
jgi:cytochrome c-type biogenesis protein CcmH/NrfG